MIRRLAVACGVLLALAGLSGCGNDSVAGKTTTTGNGGGLVAVGPDGQALAGCLVLAARSWDPVHGVPGVVDTLRSDADGLVRLPLESYAFVEMRDERRSLGAWKRRVSFAQDQRQVLRLDSLHAIRGRWKDASGGRMGIDSSFQASGIGTDGGFSFTQVPKGNWMLRRWKDGMANAVGVLRVSAADVGCDGCGNVSVAMDTSLAPLWIDDFETGSNLPRLHASVPSVSPWFLWWVETDMILPDSNDGASISKAIRADSVRAGNSFHGRFAPRSSDAWIALGLTGLQLDWSGRQELCFGYRSDTALKIQLHRDSVGSLRPTMTAWAPASRTWRDACLPLVAFAPEANVPDSLRAWTAFGRRILGFEFQSPGGTYLDLDDVLVR